MRKKPEEGRTGSWLTTFNDLITLLLTFFVLTLSLSNMDEAKVKEMSLSLGAALGRLKEGAGSEFRIFEPFVTPMGRVGMTLELEKQQIAERLRTVGEFEVRVTDEGVLVTMEEQLFFPSGRAEISDAGQSKLIMLAEELRSLEGDIRVAGHTDDVPINTDRFPSNWELSVGRATGVVRYLVSEGHISPERLSASGYADSRPRVPGTDADARAANRRVEMTIIIPG